MEETIIKLLETLQQKKKEVDEKLKNLNSETRTQEELLEELNQLKKDCEYISSRLIEIEEQLTSV